MSVFANLSVSATIIFIIILFTILPFKLMTSIFNIIILFYIIPYRDQLSLCFKDNEKCFKYDGLCILDMFNKKLEFLDSKDKYFYNKKYTSVLLFYLSIIFTYLIKSFYDKLNKKLAIILITFYFLFIVITLITMYYAPLIPYYFISLLCSLYCILKPIVLPIFFIFFSALLKYILSLMGIKFDLMNFVIIIIVLIIINNLIFNFDGTGFLSTNANTSIVNTIIDYFTRLFTLGFMNYTKPPIIPQKFTFLSGL
jgi:hypothetical protein